VKFKPLLYWTHRWLGIATCLLFASWFASGIIMMYVEYPALTEEERLTNLPPLNLKQVSLTPFEASTAVSSVRVFSVVKLTSVLGRPAFEFRGLDDRISLVFADTGRKVGGLSEESALAAAEMSGFAGTDTKGAYGELVEMDQWSISASLNVYRPLHRVNLNDAEGGVVYVSGNTGQVVLDTTRRERFWNWLGSVVHWIYPLQLRKNTALWVDVIVYLSLAGIISVITGGIIGFMRIRIRKGYRGKDYSPYQGWMKWHHVLGLFVLIFVFTFIFSGLMSMGPWGIFNSSTSSLEQISRYRGNDSLRLSNLPMPEWSEFPPGIKEVEWHQIQRSSYYSLVRSKEDKEIRFGSDAAQNSPLILLARISEAIPSLLPDAKLESIELINEPDNYYYARHSNYRPFPVYRAKFDDPESTWYHIDLNTGEVVNRVTNIGRWERWLFNGLHSLDFQVLLRNRPVWDVLVIFLSLLGFLFSLTAVVVAWRRLVS